jgi:hypothetical protein
MIDTALFRYIQNNNDFRSRKYIKIVQRTIGEYRLLANNNRGFIRQWANRQANEMEKNLNKVMVK